MLSSTNHGQVKTIRSKELQRQPKSVHKKLTLTYCVSGSDSTVDYISNVEIGTLNNSSFYPAGGYSDYTIYNTMLIRGDSVLLTITNGAPTAGAQCGVWIDWNHNADFLDDTLINVTGGPGMFTAMIKAPVNAIVGDACLRIVITTGSTPEPCGTDHIGETEDYALTLIPVDFHEVEVVDFTAGMIAGTYPASFHPEVEVYNLGLNAEPFTPVTFIFNNSITVTDTIFDTLYPDDQLYYQFTDSIIVDSCGNYPIVIYTSIPIPNDLDFDDDTVTAVFSCEKYLSVNPGGNIQNIVESILPGSGVSISNVTFTGDTTAVGTFGASCANFGLDAGIILSTGHATTAIGPNNSGSAGTDLGLPGDSLLSSMIAAPTYDAALLEFNITPVYDSIKFRYIFGSEEYPEFIGQTTDAFAFFVSGPAPDSIPFINKNIALVPGTTTPVSINTINYGLDDAGACMNCEYYVKNTGNTLQLDSYTTPLTASFAAIPGATYHIKIAIADARDHLWDSDVFLESGSFTSPSGNASVTGVIQYDNSAQSPLPGVTLKLMQNDSVIAQTVSNQYGHYSFSNIPAGNYTLDASSTAPWGGGNALDALQILKYFTGSVTLEGLSLLAADLNGDQTVNASDALLVIKRFVGVINEFPIHKDWVFETPNINVSAGAPIVQNIKGVCYGDVNGSFIP